MVFIEELLFPLKPRIHVLVALQETLVNALGESLQQVAELFLGVLGTDTQLQRSTNQILKPEQL